MQWRRTSGHPPVSTAGSSLLHAEPIVGDPDYVKRIPLECCCADVLSGICAVFLGLEMGSDKVSLGSQRVNIQMWRRQEKPKMDPDEDVRA